MSVEPSPIQNFATKYEASEWVGQQQNSRDWTVRFRPGARDVTKRWIAMRNNRELSTTVNL